VRVCDHIDQVQETLRTRMLLTVVGMVLDKLPEYNGRLYKIAKVAERLMTEAGMEVVPTESYYQRYDGRDFRVSRWEGHPNEEANAIFAAMLERQLLARFDLSAFRRDARTARPMP
jgi:hypothetical protein